VILHMIYIDGLQQPSDRPSLHYRPITIYTYDTWWEER
jgi:hypothetical protein